MATSNICNCTRNIIQFSAVFKLSHSLMFLLLTLASAHLDNPTDSLSRRCGPKGIKNGSALEGNLKVVLNSLVQNVNKTGYTVSSHGENGESEVYGLAQCRGDLNASACRACVSSATKSIGENCSGSISGSIYLSGCFLRYATHNFYSQVNLSDASSVFRCDDTKLVNGTDENARGVDSQIDNLLTRVVGMAVSSNVSYSTLSEEGFYTMAQCWRDLTMVQCNQCLNSLYKNLSRCPAGTSEGEALNDNCVTRYDKDKFYGDGIPLLSPPSTGQSRATDQGKDRPKMVGLSIGGAVLVVMLVGVVVIWKRRLCFSKQRPGYYNSSSELSPAISKSKLNFKFQTLQIATQNFNPTNKIGQGGFGSVYKGVIRNGGEIAIKKLFSNREESVSDFFNEVNLISRVQHRNLVKLLGCSVDGPDKLLVYEYLPNRSLDHFLFDKNKGNILDWQRRFDIILGTASGLAYLHQESDIRIIHRDIKASNVLLDHNFKPKIADFGLVRYFDEDQTHLSTGIVGTRGYMAPEYLVHGHLTEKVDVYAFGVLVLEIISGRKNKTPTHANDTSSLLTMAWKCHVSNNLSSLIDPNIQGNYQEVLQVVHIALLCTQASATLRPSMSAVIMFLTNEGTNILEVSQPPFIDAIHLESNISTSVAPNHSKSNNSIALNHLPSNTSMSISPTLETHNPSSNISSSSAPVTSMSFGTISTGPFGPR